MHRKLVGLLLSCEVSHPFVSLVYDATGAEYDQRNGDKVQEYWLLALRAEELCGRPVSQEALLSAPTVEKLASRLLEQETNPACPPVVEIQGGDPTRRLFFCHGDFNAPPRS